MTTERRKATAEYRERVHQLAESYLRAVGYDYDAAVGIVEAVVALDVHTGQPPRRDPVAEQRTRDVLSLLTRRAETVNCPQPR